MTALPGTRSRALPGFFPNHGQMFISKTSIQLLPEEEAAKEETKVKPQRRQSANQDDLLLLSAWPSVLPTYVSVNGTGSAPRAQSQESLLGDEDDSENKHTQ